MKYGSFCNIAVFITKDNLMETVKTKLTIHFAPFWCWRYYCISPPIVPIKRGDRI